VKRVSGPAYDRIELAAPTQTFEKSISFQTADGPLLAEYWGPAHCDGDLIVYHPQQKIAFTGDLLFVGRFPWLGDCDLDGWIGILERLAAMDLQTVVPGHGPVSTLNEVAQFRDLLAALRSAVAQAIAAGAPRTRPPPKSRYRTMRLCRAIANGSRRMRARSTAT
jgi:cyclase